jgi:hypothetical protein
MLAALLLLPLLLLATVGIEYMAQAGSMPDNYCDDTCASADLYVHRLQ